MSDKIQEDEDRKAVNEHFAGRRSIDDLTEEQVELAVDMQYERENGDVEPEIPEEKQEPEVKEELPIDDRDQRLAEALAEKNRVNQLLKDREKKLEDLKTDEDFRNRYLGIETEVKVDNEKDYLDDKFQAEQAAKIAVLQAKDAEREKERQEEKEELARERAQLDTFREIGDLQDSHNSLKTSESFQKIDRKFIDWKTRAIAAGVEEDKYYSDAEYRKQKDKEGYKLNVSEKDRLKALKIYELYGKYKAEVDAGYNSSIDRVFRTSSDYQELMEAKLGSHRRADDDALNRLIDENSREVSLLDTGGAPAEEGDIGALLDEQDRLSRKTSLSPADKKRYFELDKQINLMTQ